MAIDTIKSTAVLDGAIATADIADDAVTTDKLANAINTDIAAKAPTASPAFTGNVGIGTTPASKLHILDSTDGGASLSTAIQIGRRGGTGDNAYLQTLHSGSDAVSALTFKIGSTERLRIQSGGGISFNGDTAAANALNDYEEGTWTPAVQNGWGILNPAYSSNTGTYTKIGNTVHVLFKLVLNGGSTNGNKLVIQGFPFISNSATGATGVQNILNGFFSTSASNALNVFGKVGENNTANIAFWTRTATGEAEFTGTHAGTAFNCTFCGAYQTNQ